MCPGGFVHILQSERRGISNMANEKLTHKLASSDSLITLESLQAVVKGIRADRGIRQIEIRICSCNSNHVASKKGEHEKSTSQTYAHV
jgi:hypothetical protein